MTTTQLISSSREPSTKQLINSRLPMRSLSPNRFSEGSLTCFVGKKLLSDCVLVVCWLESYVTSRAFGLLPELDGLKQRVGIDVFQIRKRPSGYFQN